MAIKAKSCSCICRLGSGKHCGMRPCGCANQCLNTNNKIQTKTIFPPKKLGPRKKK